MPAVEHRGLDAYLTPALLEQLGDAVTVISPQWRYLFVSDGAARIIGKPAEQVVGADVWEVFAHVVGTPQYDAVQRAMQQRTQERLVWFFDTVQGWYEQYALPVADGLVVVVRDITEQRLAEWRAEQLSVLGEALAGATTPEQVHALVCRHALPVIGAAGGGVVLADEEHGRMRAVGWSGMDAQFAQQWSVSPLAARTPGARAHSTGKPVYLTDLEASREQFPEFAADLLRTGRHTVAALPLLCAGAALGALVVSFESVRELGVGDKRFLATTAAMAAQALLRARLLAVERASIAALQRSLLPRVVPGTEGAELAARYAAANDTAEVGGDWFDVIPLSGGRLGLAMGDVEGHDLGAAALMGLMRSAVRTSALDDRPPSLVLRDANRLLMSLGQERMVTLTYVELHALSRRVVAVSAGHLPGQWADRAGEVAELPTEVGPPLGVFDAGEHWPETATPLPPGASFAVFTDGLVEIRGEDIDTGLRRVRQTLQACAGSSAEELADALVASRGASGGDDVAVLCVHLTGDA